MRFDRRTLLKYGAAGVGALATSQLPLPALAAGEIMPKSGPRVVVVGGGWGGATAAKYLRLMAPSIEVVMIEKEDAFRSCPVSNWVIGGLRTMDDITVAYDTLANVHGVKVVQDTVTGIDPAAQTVTVSEGSIAYDRLILSPGITLIYDGIEGLTAETARDVFPAAWKAGPETQRLRNQLAAMEDGGTVVMTVPLSPYRCPPGPYERACMIANYLKTHKRSSKLIVLDANQKIVSKGKLFQAAWDDFYSDTIEYWPDSKVVKADPSTMTVSTDFDDIKGDVINIVPEQRANDLVDAAALRAQGRRWVAVNPWDYQSTEQPNIHVIGDATDQTTVGKVPKSGFIANSMGKVAAAAVAARIEGREPSRPSMANTCYSLVSADEGISVTAVYDWNEEESKMAAIEGAKGLSPERSAEVAANAEDWAQAIWADMLG